MLKLPDTEQTNRDCRKDLDQTHRILMEPWDKNEQFSPYKSLCFSHSLCSVYSFSTRPYTEFI